MTMARTVALREHPQHKNPTKYCVTIIDGTSTLVDIWIESKEAAEALVDLFTSDSFHYRDESPK